MHWVSRSSGSLKCRMNQAVVVVGDKIYLIGRRHSRFTDSYIDVQIFDLNTFTWTVLPKSQLPNLRNRRVNWDGHISVVYEHKVYVWAPWTRLFCFDTVKKCWTKTGVTRKNSLALNRQFLSGCVWRYYMYIFGGNQPDVHYLNFKTMRWGCIEITGVRPKLRKCHYSSVVIDDIMYMFGGMDGMDNCLSELWCFNFITNKWNLSPGYGQVPEARESHSAFVYNRKMYIFGGNTKHEYLNDMYEFNPKTKTWQRISINGIPGPCCRAGHDTVVINDRMFLIGGFRSSNQRKHLWSWDWAPEKLNDLFVLDFKPSLYILGVLAVSRYNLSLSLLPPILRMEVTKYSCKTLSENKKYSKKVSN